MWSHTERRFRYARTEVLRHRVSIHLVVQLLVGAASCRYAWAQETPPQAVQRALNAHGRQLVSGEIVDSVSEGRLTLFNVKGPQATFNVTLLRKGKAQLQRIIKQGRGEVRQGSDGIRNWDSWQGWFSPRAKGGALQFIESQTVRSIQSLFNHQSEGLILRDQGKKGKARVLEAEDKKGEKTKYFIDDDSSLITRLEFVTGRSKDLFGKPIDRVDAYVFSDFRRVQGVLTPFKIERYRSGMRIEEMQFTSVRYNASVKDQAFRP